MSAQSAYQNKAVFIVGVRYFERAGRSSYDTSRLSTILAAVVDVCTTMAGNMRQQGADK
jgi:hypothetical protein